MITITLKLLPSQIMFLVKVLKNYKKLRKAHFWNTEGGYKREKITEEVLLVDGLIAYMENELCQQR